MSQQNVEIVRGAYEHFREAGDFREGAFDSGLVWDMSTFRGWPEQQTYQGIEGARAFIRDWVEAWDDWELEVESLHDADEEALEAVGLAE